MTAIITEKFRSHNADQFFESFTEASGNAYYLMIGKPNAFTTATSGGTDESPPTPADDISSEFYVWDSSFAAKKIASTNITYAIPRRNWANSTVYDMYEDNINSSNATTSGATNIFDSEYFFKTSDNRVYKVLDNNSGAAYSGAEPTSESTSSFVLGGYTLKYMYAITASEQATFLTTDFMPVSTDTTVSAAAVNGAIESIIITNVGSGLTNGTYFAAVYGDGTSSGTSSGAIIKIIVASNVISAVSLGSLGSGIQQAGAGYTFGTVNLGSGFTFSDTSLSSASAIGGSGAAISVVISPKGGHGSNAITELGGHYVMLQTSLEGTDNDDFLTGNDFRNINLVVDPTTFGTSTVGTASTFRTTYAMKFSGSPGTFIADEVITQTNSDGVVATGTVVEYDSTLKILYYQHERFGGVGTLASTGGLNLFSGTGTVTGASSSATGTPDDTADSAVSLAGGNTITFTDGFANPELQPDSGNIIYRENRKPISRATDQTEDIKIIVEF
tara:strand:+ start:26 stop:1531 length:1506 start_codon:yes stop_codon:yes gene_type:complete